MGTDLWAEGLRIRMENSAPILLFERFMFDYVATTVLALSLFVYTVSGLSR